MIEVQNLSKKYGEKLALENISFSVKEGEILGFLGPNGAGKSTTMNIIAGYISSNDGVVKINNHSILEEPLKAKKNIGYLPEIPPVYLDMTVKAYLNFIFDLKKLKENKKQHIEEICSLVKITDVYNRLIKNLSKGYKQRVGLAGALLGNPNVLILDEPTVGLDPKQIIEIRDLIKNLGKKHTVILSSHILSEIQAVCDRVLVINNGKIVADDTPENLSSNVMGKNTLILQVEGSNETVTKTLEEIDSINKIISVKPIESEIFEYQISCKNSLETKREIFRRLAEIDSPILLMKNNDVNLEDIFLKLTQNDQNNQSVNSTAQEVMMSDNKNQTDNSESFSDTPLQQDENNSNEPQHSED